MINNVFYNKKGITMIALVVTIAVLIILAGVSIYRFRKEWSITKGTRCIF